MAANVTKPTPEFMSLEELANAFDLSLTVAYQLARKNALPIPALKIGGQYRFSRRAYKALATAQHPQDADDAA